ncbi:ATP-dependent zinc metalloprotease FtsH [Salinisphaera sp. USBA-960]|uniref:ATP-dependent zinc metalloprotease FtsH n=1 Tax=Salinisphaera orenii TaxID=856731 RepID=UPI000DBE6202|nr:ATP-dependent zinc metalloprotease FtsH [Salifodinibacter halophilus]NNC25532.1 ATP-dependent zinc metalloprotease FtsH [Salifodinibacter halophilus]
MNELAKNLLLWVVIALVLMTVFSSFAPSTSSGNKIAYSNFLAKVKSNEVSQVKISGKDIEGSFSSGRSFSTVSPETNNEAMIGTLMDHNVEIVGEPADSGSFFKQILISWFPFLLLIGVWIYFMRQMQGGGGGRGAMSFGKSKAKQMAPEDVKMRFADVAGVEEAKTEVQELVEFLSEPSKFQRVGGQIPRGVLMVGSPGTGKTMLARAIAGEAGVPFFSISGSDFVEMFVGVGASRVRDMFEQAKKQAPCIIFVDELDAVGRQRGAGMGGGHDEREQTLNQMLVEMDGFEGNEGVIVIAATNRPDVLDPALLRPGRFDRQVVVPLPDVRGREQILNVHMKDVPIQNGVNTSILARGTPGFSGADLANLVNEAALFAARADHEKVSQDDFERAKDKILMGAERKSMVMTEDEKKLTAYHESGHAIIGLSVPQHDPVHKVTIVPRGQAMGVTMFLPEEDRYSYSRQRLISQICSLYGGRLAEEIIFGKEAVTTGASNDIERVTEIANNMVTKWGLSERMGPITYHNDDDQPFLGKSAAQSNTVSDETTHAIDVEVRRIIDECYERAREILENSMPKLHLMADALMKYETIDRKQIDRIMNEEDPGPPQDWIDNPGSDGGNGSGGAGAEAGGRASEPKPDSSDVPSPAQNRHRLH